MPPDVARTALVTGASGHLGAHLVRELLAHGYRVVALVRSGSDLAGLAGLDVTLRRGDVLDRKSFVAAARGCGLIFHAAAVVKVWARNPEEVLVTAREGTRNAVFAAAAAGARRLICTSSTIAVGSSARREALRTEADWTEVSHTVYCQAKMEAERLAWHRAEARGVPLVVVCPTGLIGPHDHRLSLVMRLVRDWVQGTGILWEGSANFVAAADAARAHRLAAERGRPGARYIAAGENVYIPDMGPLMRRLVGRSPIDMRPLRPLLPVVAAALELGSRVMGREPLVTRATFKEYAHRHHVYDARLAREELGWRSRGFEPALREAIAWLLHTRRIAPGLAAEIADAFPPDPMWHPAPPAAPRHAA